MILFSSLLSLFFGALLLAKKQKSKADYILFAWLAFISLHLFFFNIYDKGLYHKYPHLIGIDLCFPIFEVLFLFFYVREATGIFSGFKFKDILHLLPSIAIYIYTLPFFSMAPDHKFKLYLNIHENYRVLLQLTLLITIISAIVYTYCSFIMIEKYKKYLGEQFSFTDRINLFWMKRLLLGMIFVWAIVILAKLTPFFLSNHFNINYNNMIALGASFFVVFIAYYGIRQTSVFTDYKHIATDPAPVENSIKERYMKSGLKEEQTLIVKEKLLFLMENEKRYLDCNLTLSKLAKEIDIHPNYLSQVINEQFNKNFYDFINCYRLKDFKIKSGEPKFKNYSVLALALECGFNSKSAFYSFCKRQTGIKPSEFLKKQISSKVS